MTEKNYVYRLIREQYAASRLREPSRSYPEEVNRALGCMNQNLLEMGFDVAAMRKECRISNHNFSTRFRYFIGSTPLRYLLNHRIECARQMILQASVANTLSEIAFEVGFAYPSTFSIAFKKYTGYTPYEYRSYYKKK